MLFLLHFPHRSKNIMRMSENISHQLNIFCVIYDCVGFFQLSSQISMCYFYYLAGQDSIWNRSFKLSYSYHSLKTIHFCVLVASHEDYDLLKQLNYSLSTKRTIQDYKLFFCFHDLLITF